jgi:predicted DNA-binding ribbon-helix-helix protein
MARLVKLGSAGRVGTNALCVIFVTVENFFSTATPVTRILCSAVACLLQGRGGSVMKSLVVKRSVVFGGNKTSVSLEDAFWNSLREIARYRQVTLSALLGSIDSERHYGNFSSAIRLFVLDFYRDQLSKRDSRGGPEQIIGHSVFELN